MTGAEMHGESRDSSTFTQIGVQANYGYPQPVPPEVRRSLPPDTAAFTGRDDELRRITAVTDAAGAAGVVAIHAIGGMPGVGKTALAVHVAYLLRGQFPDRQLFIDLRAHTPGQDPVLPEAALAGLLAAVGVDARHLPDDLQGRAGMWRDRMAGEHALLVLDNAATSDQVKPLLPGGDGCLVLVTSRRYLGDLPAAQVPLDALPPGQAQDMFMRLAPRAETSPAPAVPELVSLAGYLPLAISLLARLYARHTAWTLADLIRETKASLLTLTAENDTVGAAFHVSYRYLAASQQRFFRLLGLHPGITIDAYAAAALGGSSLPEAAGCLDGLHREGLLTEAAYRRYGVHDLIRLYAQDVATAVPAADRRQALDRVLDYYQRTAAISQARLAQYRTSTAPDTSPAPPAAPDLHDSTVALAWARTDRANLIACLDQVTRDGQDARVVALTAAVAALLLQDGPWADASTRHTAAAQAARHLGDQPGEANALYELGVVRHLMGEYRGAVEVLKAALGIYRDSGDRRGEANTLYDLGLTRSQRMQDHRVGIETLEAALHIYRDLGDRLGTANTLNYLAAVHRRAGDYPAAGEALDAALDIYRDLGDLPDEATILGYRGVTQQQASDHAGGAEMLETALRIYRGPPLCQA